MSLTFPTGLTRATTKTSTKTSTSTNTSNKTKTKTKAEVILGFVLAYLLWQLVALNFNLNRLFDKAPVHVPVFSMFVLAYTLAFVVNRNVRAVTLLIFVALVGKSGRSYLRAVAFAFVISGPIDNLANNAGEVARVFACTTVLTYNLTKTRFDLMAKPFTNTLKHMKEDIVEIQTTFGELQGVLADLKYGVEHTDIEDDQFGTANRYNRNSRAAAKGNATKQPEVNTTTAPAPASAGHPELPSSDEVQEKFLRNMRNRCKHQLRSGHQVCQQIFHQGYHKCKTNFPDFIAPAICWPYRVDIICKINIFGNPDKICDPAQVVPRNFGETYVKLLNTERELFDNSTNIEITYELQNSSAVQDTMRSAQQTSEAFTEDFNRRKRIFNAIMLLIEKFLCLFILRVIFASIQYFLRYRRNVEFDNFYITDYFKHVDKRRKDTSKRSILPLKSYEKPNYVDVDHVCSRTAEESRTVIYHLLQLSLEVITVGLFLLMDRMVVNLLRIINKRSLIEYHQEGEHEVRFHINGTGLMARLLRTTMKNFNIHERVSTSLSNEDCLPKAHVLPNSFYYKLLLLYLAIILLIYQSTTFLRLRRVICSYFFYKREKQRILFLYNRMLRDRQSNFEILRLHAEENLASRRVQDNVNICLRLRLSFPEVFGCLSRFSCAKRNCLICDVLENGKFVICPNCGLPYCRDCCLELKSHCISCDQIMLFTADQRGGGGGDTSSDETSGDEIYSYRKEK
ncbi:uncharacterized protein Dwil_GK16778 [Drosophila willistoni]|uniref:Dendritic cell-specific transmembrane protein-like domain-containing protein n=1 Tax=Drosophila willistoni TaxID=7260 RepID=B4MM00_DROWI|nr:uncharacterized protein Dwil_GK16778 [Drosophila willistoni]